MSQYAVPKLIDFIFSFQVNENDEQLFGLRSLIIHTYFKTGK